MDVNYFVCTLGQAALPDVSRPFRDVNHLIDEQASRRPDEAAVGFYSPSQRDDTYNTVVLTFADVKQGVEAVADVLAEKFEVTQSKTVGLLCSSSPLFFFSWLALIRLGHPVLLIAPQCSASAIAHLSKACEAPLLFHDATHLKLASDAVNCSTSVKYSELSACELPISGDQELFKIIKGPLRGGEFEPVKSGTDVVYLHHTSGTSTGIPKPIPQTNHGAIGVLPSLDGSMSATFTTTPLYHGGPADIFRAWTSNALIWLFPGHHAPITAANIIKCLDASSRATTELSVSPIKYFSSVPYVLQMMAQESQGMAYLQKMDLVGVGGAALPPEVGDMLVDQNVNLLSRYGSAECGFLMSSHRDYQNDKDWQYLRRSPAVQQLVFEPNGDGQNELVISSSWPHMAKRNRDDGSFATADLFAPHPKISHAWRYHSRADSQMTLVTGKKFDPSPLENSLAAALPVLNEVLVFGNGQQYPGALIFRSASAKNSSDSELVRQVAPIMENLNNKSESFARIPQNMLIPMPYQECPLEKSSKGTILRGNAEKKYQKQIEQAYHQVTLNGKEVSDGEVSDAILNIVKSILGSESDHDQLDESTNLFAYGIDSLGCAQVRRAIAQLIPTSSRPLPLSIVEDSGNVAGLSEVVLRVRKGKSARLEQDQDALMLDLASQYSVFQERNRSTSTLTSSSMPEDKGTTVLMTGPTGSLGAFILSQLLENPKVGKIYLLVRGSTQHAAKERVLKALSSRNLPVPDIFDDRVCVMSCKLSDPQLGLSTTDYDTLTTEVDMIFHLAWSVNFLISLHSLASTHLAGLQNLLNLALASKHPLPPHFLFCSSVASVSRLLGPIPEAIVQGTTSAGPTGYARSKLVAELVCAACTATTKLAHRISVLRVGQLSGDTRSGVWNTTEAYPLLLAGSKATGVLPDLQHEILNWLPVDVAARCFIEAALHDDVPRPTNGDTLTNTNVRVLHLLNPCTDTRFPDLLRCLETVGEGFEIVSAEKWLDRLEALNVDEKTRTHPALKLLPFWKDVYGSRTDDKSAGDEGDGSNRPEPVYVMDESYRAMPSLKMAVAPLDSEYMLKLWGWIQVNCN